MNAGPSAYLEGKVVANDEEAMEFEIDEDEARMAGQWTILARFYSLKRPNPAAMFDDLRRSWQLRTDFSFNVLRNNLFIISLGSEGDFSFVMKGGPWLLGSIREML